MKVQNNSVVSIHYTLTNDSGEVLDSSEGKDPLKYLHGAGNIIPGLENELLDCVVGDSKQVTVQPKDGYGELNEQLVQKLPTEAFGGIDKIEEGMEFQAEGPDGSAQYVVVTKVEEDGITIDGNHALAGQVLNFDVSVVEVRDATETEIEHGHVH